MNINEAAEEIKRTVSMEQVLDLYGYQTDRAGFMRCPFHAGDHTASLKVYKGGRGWTCFGCHKGGTVIDFVMNADGIKYREAVVKLDNDLGLHLTAAGIVNPFSYSKRRVISSEGLHDFSEYIRQLKRANDFDELVLLIRWMLYAEAWNKPRDQRTAEDWTIIQQEEENGAEDFARHCEYRRKEGMTIYEYQHQDGDRANAERNKRQVLRN